MPCPFARSRTSSRVPFVLARLPRSVRPQGRSRFTWLTTATLLVPAAALAQSAQAPFTTAVPDVVVSATREPIPTVDVGSTVSIITGEELEQRQIRLVSDALRAVPGVAVNNSGPTGTLSHVRIRGAESNQTVVLVDGIKINDPFTAEVDFAHLLTAQIDRIEVLRGPQSVIFGSEAIGGVISIFTKRGTTGLQSGVTAEGGSFGTGTGSAYLRGADDYGNFALSLAGLTTDGTNISRFGSEKDDYWNWTLNGTGSYNIAPDTSIHGVLRYVDSRTQFDPQDFSFPPGPTYGLVIDGDQHTRYEQFNGRIGVRNLSFDGRWENQLSVAGTSTNSNSFGERVFTSAFKGERTSYLYQTTVRAPDLSWTPALTLSAEHQDQRYTARGATFDSPQNQTQTNDFTGLAGELRVKLPTETALTASVRQDWNTLFQDSTTWRVTAAQPVHESAKLRTSIGTGVANPTFFELFGFIPGQFDPNPNLKAEESTGVDAGADIAFDRGRGLFSITAFYADLTDEIVNVFDPNTFRTTVTNLSGHSRRRGVELELNWAISAAWNVFASYSYIDSFQPDGQPEVRRPRNLAAAAVNYNGGRWGANLRVDFNGTQQDLDFTTFASNRVQLPSFTLVGVSGFYQLMRDLQLTARIENLLDQRYEEVFSYRASGIGFFGGVRAQF